MAASAQEMKYAVNGTYGSAAYDLDRLENYDIPLEESYEAQPAEKTLPRERVWEREYVDARAEAIEQAKAAQSISVLSVAGFVAAAALMVFILLSYVKLTEISFEVSSLNTTISELSAQQKKLEVEYALAFNVNEVEDYVENVLGMVKMTEANTTVYSMQRDNEAEVLGGDSALGGVLDRVGKFISSLTEYLKR